MSLVAKAIDKLVNPPRVDHPDRLRDAVSGATVLVTGSSYGNGEATACKLTAENSSVAGAASMVVESSLSRAILGICERCGRRTIVGGADGSGAGGAAVRASRWRTQVSGEWTVNSIATRTARLSAQITTSNVLVICWARLLP